MLGSKYRPRSLKQKVLIGAGTTCLKSVLHKHNLIEKQKRLKGFANLFLKSHHGEIEEIKIIQTNILQIISSLFVKNLKHNAFVLLDFTFTLLGDFSNVASNLLPEQLQSYIGCICGIFLKSEFWGVSSNILQ